MITSVQIVEISMLNYIPELVAWLVGIILAVLMVRWGGGKAEKLLLAGCSLIFAVKLAIPLLYELINWQALQGDVTPATGWLVNLLGGIVVIAGFVCLVYAFWVRFRARRQEAA
jgi:ABC-type amino acid transport system permease subunit